MNIAFFIVVLNDSLYLYLHLVPFILIIMIFNKILIEILNYFWYKWHIEGNIPPNLGLKTI